LDKLLDSIKQEVNKAAKNNISEETDAFGASSFLPLFPDASHKKQTAESLSSNIKENTKLPKKLGERERVNTGFPSNSRFFYNKDISAYQLLFTPKKDAAKLDLEIFISGEVKKR
jgi:hypothetical protein